MEKELSHKDQLEKAKNQPSLLSMINDKEKSKEWLDRAESGEIMRII